jgi:precorrin-2 dehydrogenase / sirohydrochlorin ferrochelatase
MLIDLDLNQKSAVVLGGGSEAELKAAKLVDAGASTTVVARRFTNGLRALSQEGKVRLIERDPRAAETLIREIRPRALFISTGESQLDEELANLGRSLGILVCVVDTPRLNDFNMPALAKVGTLRIAISTGGKSPAMAKMLRKRIEKMILPEDLLQVELQESIRGRIGGSVKSHAARKRMVYDVIRDPEVTRLLKANDLPGAKARAASMIRVHKRSKERA